MEARRIGRSRGHRARNVTVSVDERSVLFSKKKLSFIFSSSYFTLAFALFLNSSHPSSASRCLEFSLARGRNFCM